MRTLRLNIQIQFTQHVSKRSGWIRHHPLNLFAILPVFQMIQEQLCDQGTLHYAADPAEIVGCPSKGRVDLDTEVHQWHRATNGGSTSLDQYSSPQARANACSDPQEIRWSNMNG